MLRFSVCTCEWHVRGLPRSWRHGLCVTHVNVNRGPPGCCHSVCHTFIICINQRIIGFTTTSRRKSIYTSLGQKSENCAVNCILANFLKTAFQNVELEKAKKANVVVMVSCLWILCPSFVVFFIFWIPRTLECRWAFNLPQEFASLRSKGYRLLRHVKFMNEKLNSEHLWRG